MKSVLLLWYQIGDNFGDILLYRTTRDFLLDMGIEVISCEVGNPCYEVIEKANKCDFLLFAGGGIIERYVPNVIRHFKEDYHLLKVPYGVIGLGVCDFDYSVYREEIRFWIEHSEFFYVRDVDSKNRVQNLTGSKMIKSSADCVLHNTELLKYGSNIEYKVGVNLRDIPHKDLVCDFDKKVLNNMCEESGVSIIVPDSSDEQWKKLSSYENKDVLVRYMALDRAEKVEVTLNEIRRCEYVIAMRFHVVLVSAIFGIVPIPILYHPKVRSLSNALGLEEISVELYELEDIPKKLRKAKENRDMYKMRIKNNLIILKRESDGMYDDIKNFFK